MIANYRKTNDYNEWALFIISIEILYVITELAFNSAVLNATGGLVWSRDSISTLEFYGRILSGFGFGLMILKLKKFKTTEFKARFNFFFIVLLFAVPVMYFSQKIIIDESFIKRSSNEMLEKADQSMILKRAFQMNSIRVGNIEFKKDELTDPNSMSLTAMLGILFMGENETHELLKNNSYRVFLKNGRYFNDVSSERSWEGYNAANSIIDDAWDEYNKASQEFKAKRNKELSSKMINDRWNDVENITKVAFEEFLKARRVYFTAVREKAIRKNAYKKMSSGYNRLRKCRNNSCVNRMTKAIKKAVKKATGFDKPLSYWCQSGSRCKIDDSYLNRQLAYAQAESGDFKRRTGISFHVQSINVFKKQKVYIKDLTEAISTRYGISNFKDFNGTYSSFKKAYEKAVIFTLAKNWYVNSGDAFGLSPGLSKDEFYNSEIVQASLRAILGLDSSSKYIVKRNMSKATFIKELNGNVLNEKGITLKNKLLTGLSKTAQYSQMNYIHKKEEYRDSLRGIVVPPIALFFSLFFSAFILVRFPLHIVSIYFYEKSEKWKFRVRSLIIVLGVFVIFVVPLAISHSNTENQLKIDSTINHFDKAGINMTVWEWPLRWFFAAEPIVYPIGNAILGYVGINNINHPIYEDDFKSRNIDESELELDLNIHAATFSHVSKKYVREAQSILNKTGYYVGSVDGIAGKNTILKANEFANDMGFFSNEEGANPYGTSGKQYIKENKFNENLLTLILMAR